MNTTIDTVLDSGIEREEILTHLDLVMADRRFAGSERNARFLRYVVELTLDGRSGDVKESVIGTEVYGRTAGYDSKSDSIVRVEAKRLREKLQSFYENEGQDSTVRIQLPKGSYVPVFERPGVVAPPEAELARQQPRREPEEERVAAAPAASHRHTPVAIAMVFLAMAVATVAAAYVTHRPPSLSEEREAEAAWREGTGLLNLDPHQAKTESGAPMTLLRAIERLEYSVARDPWRAPAWASLAEAYDYAAGFAGRDVAEDGRRMEAAALRAIGLDPKFAPGHHMLGLMNKGIRWDFAKAEASYREALELDPRNVYAAAEFADLLLETGRPALAADAIRKARALQPASPVLAVKEAELQVYLGRADAAIATALQAIELQRTSSRAHLALGAAYEAKGDFKRALACYEYVLRADPTDRRVLPAYGYLLARMGETAAAREVILRLERMNARVRNCSFQIAVVFAGLGEDQAALDWLERAWNARQSHFPFAAVEHRFAKLSRNARFQELLGKVGLKPQLAG